MGPLDGGAGLVPVLPEYLHADQEVVDGKKTHPKRGKPPGVTTEPSMVSPRLIPVPGSPTNSGRPDPPPTLEDTGNSSASFGRKCASSQTPECEIVNHDHLSYDQLRNPCKLRGYNKKDAKVALNTRLEAMDAVARQPLTSNEKDMGTSPSVLGKMGSPHGGAIDY